MAGRGRRSVTPKQEVNMEVQEPVEVSRKRPWHKVDADGNKIKHKKVPGAKHMRVCKHVQPKNALLCLYDLVPRELVPREIITFDAVQYDDISQQYGVTLTIEENIFFGSGPSEHIAKQNAAEAALASLVKPPLPKAGPGEEKIEEKTPWPALAAFAMFKLFNEWKDGHTSGTAPSDEMTASILAHLGTSATDVYVPRAAAAPGDTNHTGVPFVMKPAAKLPDNAATLHPVMLLHQMKPAIQYATDKSGEDYYVSLNIDGQDFTGEGPSIKKAKFALARDALYALYGVESVFENPA